MFTFTRTQKTIAGKDRTESVSVDTVKGAVLTRRSGSPLPSRTPSRFPRLTAKRIARDLRRDGWTGL